MSRYLCALCGAPLAAEEVEPHFRACHPTAPLAACGGRELVARMIQSGLILPVKNGRPAAGYHTCALCGFRSRFYAVAAIHALVEHPAEARQHLGGEANLREAFAQLVRAGLIAPATVKKRRRDEEGRGGGGQRWGELEGAVERAVSTLLSRHLGRTARLLPGAIARAAVGERAWRRYGPIISGRVSALLSRWLTEERVVVDALGRRWQLRSATGGGGRPRAAFFARLD